jgi:acyl-CoA reductase-like NAD-dependent aldehyde dehydrogenase
MTETEVGSFTLGSRLLINGELVEAESGRRFDNINPAVGEVPGQVRRQQWQVA